MAGIKVVVVGVRTLWEGRMTVVVVVVVVVAVVVIAGEVEV